MQTQNDVVLIGAGIMSTTLGVIMQKLMPGAKISIYEKLESVAAESSDSWNNAGTGHSAFCELNYTPKQADGSVSISKALDIASSFEISRQFWAYLKEQKVLTELFIKTVPHMSFLWGEDNISFLKKRHETMTPYALFEDMKYSEDFDEIASWVPMMMKNRDRNKRMGVTRMVAGTDVDFEAITRDMIAHLKNCDGVEVHAGQEVKGFKRQADGSWKVKLKDLKTGKSNVVHSKFVFVGSGGGSLPLLQKSGIKEGKGYGGFPVSGKFMRCKDPEIIEQHRAKVYGKAAEGSPPMSMPHLDERRIDGEDSLLFGPYAGMSLKFLKTGSIFDLPGSIRLHNIWPMLSVARHEFGLIKYLVGQVMQSTKERFKTLKIYFPEAQMKNWELYTAGQRVQIMKKDKKKGGVLKLGTEIINNEEGSFAALLGASPGASTAVSIMFNVLNKCFPEQMATDDWKNKLTEMIPSYGKSLIDDQQLCRDTRKATAKVLGLDE
ncbi:MAG: malate dehydrogenase (quinone) [Bacteroidales bacterium]|jgi:malate dehydrogenase (quinone)|nr:malate dehydrogenase (quinone) [Bacteroidales bacterium]